MDFELTDEQLELRRTSRSMLSAARRTSVVRRVHEGWGDASADLWSILVGLDRPALGLPGARVPGRSRG